VRQLAVLLDNYHYNRGAVLPSDYTEIISSFMGDLDGQRLFFLNTDRAAFEKRHASSLYYNIRELGSIDAAFEIFDIYDKRMKDRAAWIFDTLGKDIDVNSREFYRLDRSKSEWPDSVAASDDLWQRRLKFEIVTEMMNKKSLDDAKKEVRKRYERMLRNVADIEPNDIAELFLSAYAHLYDPHSSYLNKDTLEDFNIQMKLKLVGIGAVLSIEDGICVIKEIMPGTPAGLDKRLKPNDKILAVSQDKSEPVDIIGMKLRRIVDRIRGEKGTQVRLIVQPGDDLTGSVRKEIVLTRDVVKINSARAHAAVFEVPNPDGKGSSSLGVISLPSFYGGDDENDTGEKISASKDVAELLTRLKAENVQGVVLDMRRNGGGLLSEAIDITGLFIDSGPVVQVRDYEGHINVDNDDDTRVIYSGPMAVLVDRFSASASEIVAGALQNYGRAIVVGDSSTHGKGTVQTVIPMQNIMPPSMRNTGKMGGMRLTIQKFYLPSGASTQMKGVVPDIVLPSFEDFLPIGEVDLPHALVWDEIPSSFFDGKPLSPLALQPLLEGSQQRQKHLEEFAYLRKNIDWYKTRQEQKLISINLDDRKKQKTSDDAFQKEMKAERQLLEKNSFAFHEVRLVPAPPPRPKPAPKPGDATDPDDPLDDQDQNDSYGKLDVHLKESLRVVVDALYLGRDPKRWAHNFAPLTVEAVRNGG
jgi:carboxyl-terminal processing protease